MKRLAGKYTDLSHYLLLLFIVMIGTSLFYLSKGYADRQFLIVLGTALAYVFWGVSYHLAKGDFHPRIMIEYLLIAVLSIFLLRGAIYH
jgi:hypothetical protein